jgi:hypothetical protein
MNRAANEALNDFHGQPERLLSARLDGNRCTLERWADGSLHGWDGSNGQACSDAQLAELRRLAQV